ncbi:ABC transporter permease [Galbibacter sp. EGI 63066]|uniref:FtsX-like permease family protein n=1 Tax=Galbibacter sp. EGI 63066 TaxID=2993559 RepID=UPI002249617D|nr:FtsX-like permease family protein [Galbibacter sp. EGI 63066]MCX2681746.1 ABC transporter permease [Galbibacter sp. EGI 63066]
MIKNYFKIALRNLWKDKTFTGLNILGLTVAFTVAILLSIYALFELSYDRFHKNVDSIYHIYASEQTPDGPGVSTAKPIPFADALQREVPGVEKITKYMGGNVLITHGNKELRMEAAYVDPDFFSIFSFPVIKGNKQHLIEDQSSIVITEKTAKILFGEENALGRTVNILQQGQQRPYTISSILEDIPAQSTMRFNLALNFKNQSDFVYADNIGNWEKSNHSVYLKLSEGVVPTQFEKATRDFTALHYKDDIKDFKRDGIQPDKNGQYIQQRLLGYKDIHFATEKNGNADTSRLYPFLILGIAFLVLFIASANFINMSIAKSAGRLREIGMRKTLGASKAQLFFQFWGESVLIYFMSALIGIVLANLLLGQFQTIFRTSAAFGNVISPSIVIAFFIGVMVITLISGGYPSLLMTKLSTIQSLKGKLEVTGKNRLRDGLLILQFGITILLISGTLVLWDQLEYMRNKDVGFNKEQVIAFPLNGKREDAQAIQLMRNELADTPGIVNITASNNILGLGKDGTSSTSAMGFDYKGRGVKTNILIVDHDYTETLDLEIIKGRSFSRDFKSDSLGLIINQAMADQLQEKDPLQTQIILFDSINYSVLGVVKDFNFQGFDKSIEPLTLFLNPKWNMRNVYVKVSGNNPLQSMSRIEQAWAKIEPNAEFLGSFLDENIDRTLTRERLMTTMIGSGSILAVILSCVGLFAMSLLVVTQRRKEIGIRKVVGASVSTITLLLTKEFLKLVLIAFLIATPIAWWFTSQWLQGYVYRIDLSVLTFLLAGGIVLVIAIATISTKTIGAATQNPVKSLRTE